MTKCTAWDGTLRLSRPTADVVFGDRKGKEAARVPLSFREYAHSGLEAQWSLAPPARDFMRLGMAMQTNINALGNKKDAWISDHQGS